MRQYFSNKIMKIYEKSKVWINFYVPDKTILVNNIILNIFEIE